MIYQRDFSGKPFADRQEAEDAILQGTTVAVYNDKGDRGYRVYKDDRFYVAHCFDCNAALRGETVYDVLVWGEHHIGTHPEEN